MSRGYRLEAEYESGYVLIEDGHDHSPYDAGRNTLHAIKNGRPTEAGHGRLVRFTLCAEGGQRWTVDWRELWDTDATPICRRQVEQTFQGSKPVGPQVLLGQQFGYAIGEIEHIQEAI